MLSQYFRSNGSMTKNQARNTILLVAVALGAGGCASLQPPSVTGPRGNEPVYPVLFTEDSQRREASILALNQLTQSTGNAGKFAPQLQPITEIGRASCRERV